jgi:predicted metal-dependent enzyme (double-stranded beta helix superfamily)
MSAAMGYAVDDYTVDLRRIAADESDPRRIVERVRPLAAKLAATRGWMRDAYRECDAAQGFGVHLLHEEPDHSLAVFVICWQPDRGTLPHNHKTWAVVVGLEGSERETLWERIDDGTRPGHAELKLKAERLVRAGDVSSCLPEDIHGVWNAGAAPSISLHTYGRHINFTGRSEFDPASGTERAMIVNVAD